MSCAREMLQGMSLPSRLLASSLVLLVLGCPNPTPPPGDAGTDAPRDARTVAPDAAPDAFNAAALGTCALPRLVDVSLGAPTVVRGDTTRGARGPLDLVNCGNTSPLSRPPQDVLAVRVPGTGMTAIRFDLRTGTDAEFDTLVQVRTACDVAPIHAATTCFDNVEDVVQSAGSFTAMGGSTVYLVVTGFDGAVSEGAYTVTFEAINNAPPVLAAASARRVNSERLEVRGTGSDADANAVGFALQYLNASGALISGASGVGPFAMDFDSEPPGAFTNALATRALVALEPAFASATSLRVALIDALGATSATRDVRIEDRMEMAYGESCDALRGCVEPNVCEAGTCQATAPLRAACSAAMSVTLDAPNSTSTVSRQAAGIPIGAGLFNSCRGLGGERIFNVTVPNGRADFIVSTVVDGTAATFDTVVYIRRVCGNALTEIACNDDYGVEGDYRSRAEARDIAAGDYAVFIDSFAPIDPRVTVAFELVLRPVLATGAACDSAGVLNRCAAGACPSSGAALCP